MTKITWPVFFISLLLPFLLFAHHPKMPRLPDPRLAVLKAQVIKDILEEKANEADALQLAAAMKADGSWPDIDYTDKTRGGWPVNDHLVRLNTMTLVYKHAGTASTGNRDLEKKIISGLNYWLQHDFICPNWWYPQIGVPKALAPVMLLMEDKLTTLQMQEGVKILDRAKIGMTGQNKVWLSGNVIYRSLLNDDTAAIEAAVKAIQDEIVVSEGEGVQPDYSFHQHGTQQQFGNYGSSYAADMLKWAGIFQPTTFHFDTKKIVVLRNYLLNGMRWIIWKQVMDISACGRQLFPHAQAGKASTIRQIYGKMPLVDPSFSDQYKRAMNDFDGDKHFWRSDMTVHRRENFYASVKMSSRRVGGAESCNEENIQGYHLGDGATYFYQSNREYTDIFPFWDWKMIPGITAFHDNVPLPVLPCSGYNIPSDFVGGVSDSSNGIASLSYKRDSLSAQKSWFFFDDAIICLGAGIHSDLDKEVRTTVNQSFLQGTILVKQASTQSLDSGDHQLSQVNWVLHDNWGYYFPGKANIAIANREQSGDWHKVLTRMPSSPLRSAIFSMWFNHGARPDADRYAYYVFPAATKENIDARAAAFQIISNTAMVQAVENQTRKMAGIVFAQAAAVRTHGFGKIGTDKPCILMLTRRYADWHISVADPTHQQTSVELSLPGNKKCATASALYNKSDNSTRLTIPLPAGPEAGRTVTLMVE